MSKYSSYTDEFKEALVQKVFANSGKSVKSVSEEAGIPISTLRNWTDNYKHRTGKTVLRKKRNRLKSIDKFNAVVITSSMNESEKSEYCRKQGIYPEDLEQWKQDCISGCGGELNKVATQKNKRQVKEWKQEAKRLQKELTRKEKALAETAALLVLKKKADKIWGEPEEER